MPSKLSLDDIEHIREIVREELARYGIGCCKSCETRFYIRDENISHEDEAVRAAYRTWTNVPYEVIMTNLRAGRPPTYVCCAPNRNADGSTNCDYCHISYCTWGTAGHKTKAVKKHLGTE